MKYDTVIIGGGMAGLLASIELAGKGLKTAVVSKGDPVCSISTGCIDLAEDYSALPENHPYKKAGDKAVETSFRRLAAILEESGLPYEGEVFVNRKILSPVAVERKTCLVPSSMAEADRSGEGSLHIITFPGMKDFFTGYFEASVSPCPSPFRTTISIATWLDSKEGKEEFLSWISTLSIKEDRIAVPAVLGTENPEALINEMEKLTGKKVFEIPTLPPSMPGLRLFKNLKRRALALGVSLFWGNEVNRFEMENNRIGRILMERPGRPIAVEGRSFILATGSFVSGGLFAERDGIHETVFGLDVSVPEEGAVLNGSFFNPDHGAGKTGIEVDGDYRPVGAPYENLFVAGSILENGSIMKHQCGHGLAAVTAFGAAGACMEYLK